MFRRCYNKEWQEKEPTYKGCKVCYEWIYFSNFKKWYKDNFYKIEDEQMELDKDILNKGNKIYSPKNCIFVPKIINCLFTKSNKIRGDLPIGVKLGKNNKYVSQYSYYDFIKNKGKIYEHIEEDDIIYEQIENNSEIYDKFTELFGDKNVEIKGE